MAQGKITTYYTTEIDMSLHFPSSSLLWPKCAVHAPKLGTWKKPLVLIWAWPSAVVFSIWGFKHYVEDLSFAVSPQLCNSLKYKSFQKEVLEFRLCRSTVVSWVGTVAPSPQNEIVNVYLLKLFWELNEITYVKNMEDLSIMFLFSLLVV